MHPAYSVILFTTASGAGFGLLFWQGALALLGRAPSGWPGALSVALALALAVAGLLSSTLHLGRPERAWRAFSQWRTSWLSREGVAAVATLAAGGLLALAALGLPGGALWGGLAALGSAATVWCTGMIYASLRTVPDWHQPLTAPLYLAFAAASGAVLLALLGAGGAGVAAAALAVALGLKLLYWRAIDATPMPGTLASALGVPGLTAAAPLDPPHSRPNFVMREMGYAVARRHARRLRRLAALLLGLAAALAFLGAVLPAAALWLGLALPPLALGLWTERWLFFAEARHVAMLYYAPRQGSP